MVRRVPSIPLLLLLALVWGCQPAEEAPSAAAEAPPQTRESPPAGSPREERSAAEPLAPRDELAGTSWQLVEILSMDDTVYIPEEPERYTLSFGEDGRVSIEADCNGATGPYESSEPGQLQFGVLVGTMASCPPGSLYDTYLGQFQWVRSYVFDGGHLFLATMADGSIIEFEPL